MVDIIFLIIILTSLLVAGFIVFKKFPQVSNLDVENLPQEIEAKKKKEIIDRRLEGQSRRFRENVINKLGPLIKISKQIQLKFRIYVGKVERLWHHEQNKKQQKEVIEMPVEQKEERKEDLISSAEQELKIENYQKAEDLFISAIKLDPKSASAYRGLADTYLAQGEVDEARQTYRFVLQIESDDDSIMVKLAEIAESQGDIEEAIEFYQKAVLVNSSLSSRFFHIAELLLKIKELEPAKEALIQSVELEPKNPRYLDLLLETAIIVRDKNLAFKTFDELRAVNPENHKLGELKDQVYRL